MAIRIPLMGCDLTKPILAVPYSLKDTAGVLQTYQVSLNIEQYKNLILYSEETFYQNGFPTAATFTQFVNLLFPVEGDPARTPILNTVIPAGPFGMQEFVTGTTDSLMAFSSQQNQVLLQPNRAFKDIVINMSYTTVPTPTV